MIHIGSIIKEKFEKHGASVSWFARQLCCDRTNIYSIFKRESIDTALLVKISIILENLLRENIEPIKLKTKIDIATGTKKYVNI